MKVLSGYIATCLWLLAVICMVEGTIDRNLFGVGWGIFSALAASGFTTWIMSERREAMREHSVEHIAEVVDALYSAKRDLRQIR